MNTPMFILGVHGCCVLSHADFPRPVCSFMQAWAGPNVRMVRVMPNTACIVGATASAMSAGPKATAADACLVRSLFAAVGTIHEVPESLLDAVTGLR